MKDIQAQESIQKMLDILPKLKIASLRRKESQLSMKNAMNAGNAALEASKMFQTTMGSSVQSTCSILDTPVDSFTVMQAHVVSLSFSL